jgi:hypothetical protein
MFENLSKGIENAEFHTDFKIDETIAKTFTVPKKLNQQK